MFNLTAKSQQMTLETTRVFTNMFNLVSLSLFLSIVTGVLSHYSGIGNAMMSSMTGLIVSIVVLFALVYAVGKFSDTSAGVYLMFLFAGFMGFFLQPAVSAYLEVNPETVLGAGIMTLAITFSMGMWGMITKRDLSGLGKILFFSLIGVIVASIMNIFFGSSFFELAISVVAVVVFSLYIMKDTNDIVQGHETNYVRASIGMYLNIVNLFLHLLRLMGGNKD